MYIKGAPEKIWNFSKTILLNGEVKDIYPKDNEIYEEINKKFAKNGERVLGFAKYHLPRSDYPKGF